MVQRSSQLCAETRIVCCTSSSAAEAIMEGLITHRLERQRELKVVYTIIIVVLVFSVLSPCIKSTNISVCVVCVLCEVTILTNALK